MGNKPVPEIRFPGVSGEWEKRKWVDTVDMSTNMVDPKTGMYDDLPHIGPGNIESFTGRLLENVKSVKEDNLISGKFHFEVGDIIYGKINPQLGKYFLSEFEGLASADSYVLNTKNGLAQSFLFCILQGMEFYKYSVSVSRRTGIPKINRDELNRFKFFSPTLEEQVEIGDFFLQLDKTITSHQQELDTFKQTKQGFLQKMFPQKGESVPVIRFPGFTGDWEQCKLSDKVEVIGTGKSKFKSNTKKSNDNTYAVLGSTDVIGYDSDFDYSGDFILTARVGANAGTLYTFSGNVKISDNTVFIQGNNLNFIYYLLSHFDIKKLSFGTGQPLVKASELKNLKLMFPKSREEKTKIGNFFKQLDDTIALHEQELETLKETKKAFLQKMFV